MMRKTGKNPLTNIIAVALCCVLGKPAAAVGLESGFVSTRIEQVQGLRTALSNLATRLDPSPEQQRQIELIILSEAPTGLMMVGEMLANRSRLLALTREEQVQDEDDIAAIANAQGRLLTRLILWKEGVKAQIRVVLTPEQQASLDAWLENLQERLVGHLIGQPEE